MTSDDMSVDISPDRTGYGIELMNAHEQLTSDQGALIVELPGRRREVPLIA